MSIEAKPFTGRKMLALMIGFFALITVVNGVFIVAALRSFPGLTEANPYQSGLAYNRVLEAAESLRALGWRLDLAIDNQASARVSLRVTGKDQRPVDGLQVTGDLRRPSDRDSDRDLVLDPVASGLYQMTTPILAAGNWDVVLHIVRPDGARHTTEQRIWVKP